MVGVTSNPTIFQKAISQGNAYDEQIKELLEHERGPEGDLPPPRGAGRRERARPARARARGERRGRLRLDRGRPDARLRHRGHLQRGDPPARVGRPAEPLREDPGHRARPEGDRGLHRRTAAASTSRCSSRSEMHKAAMEAYVRGLERFVEGGGDASKVRSVASFFVSRVDTETDKRLEAIGSDEALALRGKLAIANARIAYQHYEQVFSGDALGGARGEGRAAAAVPVGVHVDEEPRVPRRPLRRGAHRPAHREHDAGGDDPGLPGSRRGARRHGRRTASTRRRRCSTSSSPAVGVDYDDVVRDAREGGRAEVLRLVRRAARRREGQARGRGRVAVNREHLIEGIWERDATRLDRGRRSAVARLARRAAPHPGTARRHPPLRRIAPRRGRRRRPVRDGRLVARPGGAAAQLRRRPVPRPRHDAPEGDPRARGEARPRADALRLVLEVRLDARDALAYRLLLGAERPERGELFAAITDPGSELEQLARERGFRAVFAASRRSAGATPRSRRSGSCRRC